MGLDCSAFAEAAKPIDEATRASSKSDIGKDRLPLALSVAPQASACEPGFSAVFALHVDVEESVVELRAGVNTAGGSVFVTDIAWLDPLAGVQLGDRDADSRAPFSGRPQAQAGGSSVDSDMQATLAGAGSTGSPTGTSGKASPRHAHGAVGDDGLLPEAQPDSEDSVTGGSAGQRRSASGQRLRTSSAGGSRATTTPTISATSLANLNLNSLSADPGLDADSETVTSPTGTDNLVPGLPVPASNSLCARVLTLQLGGVNPGSDSDVGLRSVMLLQSTGKGGVEEVLELDASQGAASGPSAADRDLPVEWAQSCKITT